MRKFLISLAIISLLLPMSAVAAQNGQSNSTGNTQSGQTSADQGSTNTNDSTSTGSAQNQSQTSTMTQTNNPGTGTMTQEQARTELQTQLQQSEPTYTSTKTMNQARLNAVSTAVQNMLTIASRVATQNQTVSSEIQTVAQAQIKFQDQVNQSLDKAESRSGFAKFFVGPNYGELKTVKQQMEQNQLRIQELNQIVAQIANASDQTELKSQIKILEAQNTSLNEQLNTDVAGFSLFGWLSRLISKY